MTPMRLQEPGITGCCGTSRAALTPCLSITEPLTPFIPGQTTSAKPAMEAPVLPSAEASIVTSSAFTHLIYRPWECLKALTGRIWSVRAGGIAWAPQNTWADSNGPDGRIRAELCDRARWYAWLYFF